MKFEVRNRWTDTVVFTADINCDETTPISIKRALALKWARKVGADLRGANLGGADLRGANFGGADLRGANLRSADLGGANFGGADLRGANLRSADLRGANLRGANLRSADLGGADLRSANLGGADLRDANLGGAKGYDLAIARTRILADGALVGWKKCCAGVIVQLRIPAEAKRSHAFGRKCRAEFADVIEVIGADFGLSLHDRATRYTVGERVRPDSFDPNWMNECSTGIHFFITRAEAEAYN
jgi:hypothetical protein